MNAADGPLEFDAVGKLDALTTRLRGINLARLDNIDGVSVITGRAVFTDAHTVEITAGEERLAVHRGSPRVSLDPFVGNFTAVENPDRGFGGCHGTCPIP
jgi:hypothetical protein